MVFPLVAAAVVLDDFDNMAGLQLLAQLEALPWDAEHMSVTLALATRIEASAPGTGGGSPAFAKSRIACAAPGKKGELES